MKKITYVNVEHDDKSWFGTKIDPKHPAPATLTVALEIIRHEFETAPGQVTRIEFTYKGDEGE